MKETELRKGNIMISDFSATLTSIKVLGDILKATKNLHNSTEYIVAVSEIYDLLHAALIRFVGRVDLHQTRHNDSYHSGRAVELLTRPVICK